MPSSGLLRQRLTGILDEQIIPNLRHQGASNFTLATLPLISTANIVARPLSIPLLSHHNVTRVFPVGFHWKSVGVHSIDYPTLYCVVEGEVDVRLGATVETPESVDGAKDLSEIAIASMRAPSFLLIPPGVPHWDGVILPWERPAPCCSSRLLSVRVLPTGVLCHTTLVHPHRLEPGYSLLLEDSYFWSATNLLLDELRSPARHLEILQAQMMVFFLRLRRDLGNSLLLMTDGLHSRFPSGLEQKLDVQPDDSITGKACDFIQLHLHKPLTPGLIAQSVRLQPAQLNRLFRQEFGMSVMQYVMRHRLQSAKLLLQTSELSVEEISRLVGFKNTSHFSRTFLEHEGVSPLRYRQQSSRGHSSRAS